MYYQLSFNQNFLNRFQKYIKKSNTDKCRFCNHHVEDIDHIFSQCENIEYDQIKLACIQKHVPFKVKNILTDTRVKIDVQKFILKNF